MKRSPELVQLSKDHHNGLLLCWKIRSGIKNKVSVNRIAGYILYCYDQELETHFRLEESFVFPLLPEDHPLRNEAMLQHVLLRNLVGQFKINQVNEVLLQEFADMLDVHIRFEERQLFPCIEASVPGEKLAASGEQIRLDWHKHIPFWEDEFWISKRGE